MLRKVTDLAIPTVATVRAALKKMPPDAEVYGIRDVLVNDKTHEEPPLPPCGTAELDAPFVNPERCTIGCHSWSPGLSMFHPKCHPHGALDVQYQKGSGLLQVLCRTCQRMVLLVKVSF